MAAIKVAIRRALSRHGAVAVSLLVHGTALAALVLELNTSPVSAPANAEIPAVTVEIVTAPIPTPDLVSTSAPPPPPPEPPPPEAIEEPPPLIESTAAEEVAPPPPPPKVEKKPEPKPLAKPVRRPPPPKPVEAPQPVDIAHTAVQTPSPPSPAPKAQQTALAAPAGRMGPPPDYLSLLHLALERHKEYPRAARQRRQQGRATLRFAIDRDGNVIDFRIEKSSGYEILDREVVAMIQRASPLPPIPPEMNTDRLEVVVPVPFVLR